MGLKILLADDSSLIRSLLSSQLGSLGHQVVGEESTAGGVLSAYRRLAPDLIIMDIGFEDRDGLSVLREVRALDRKSNVLMLSANDQKEVKEIIKRLGSRLLPKPFTIESLQAAIQETFGGYPVAKALE